MGQSQHHNLRPAPEDYRWWHGYDDLNSSSIDVAFHSVLTSDWLSISRVSIGMTPHRVHFSRPWHTLMIFDKGSFVEGERRIDGVRLGNSGPLDLGIDVAPSNVDFRADARPGSKIGCTLISIKRDGLVAAMGDDAFNKPQLEPALNVGSELLLPLASRLRELSCSNHHIDPLYVETITTLIFQEILRIQERKRVVAHRFAGGLSIRAEKMIKDILHENISQEIDLQSLANSVGLSRFHFTRAFKTSFGIPPYRYLLKLRIKRATELLKNTELPITTIALEVGFSCLSEFGRAFKQQMHKTPREYRVADK